MGLKGRIWLVIISFIVLFLGVTLLGLLGVAQDRQIITPGLVALIIIIISLFDGFILMDVALPEFPTCEDYTEDVDDVLQHDVPLGHKAIQGRFALALLSLFH